MIGSQRDFVMPWIVASALVAGLVAGPTWWRAVPDASVAIEARASRAILRAFLLDRGEPELPLSYDRDYPPGWGGWPER